MLWLTLLAVTKLAVASLQFQEQKLSIDGRIMWAYAEDFNGDGRADLVVAFRRGYEPSTKRYVAWFEQQANGQFATTASAERAIPEDVAFAQVVDLSGAGRASLLLVSGTGVSAFSYKKDQPSETPEVLIQTPTATPFADNESLPLWDFARPWHDEKNIQIAIWRVGEIQFYSRGADGSFAATETLSLRPLTRVNSRQNGVFYGQYSNRNLSISVSHVFPELVTGDYDGDGQRDLFALDEDHLQIFLGKNGKFSNQANVVLDFAMRSQQEKQNDTAFISGRVVDLDGDGRCDYIANKVSGGLSSMRSETHIHLNHGGFKKNAGPGDQT